MTFNRNSYPQSLAANGALKPIEIAVTPNSETLSVQTQGIGIHTGKVFAVEVSEAQPGEGIQIHAFFEGIPYHTPARWSRLSGTTRATALVMRGDSKRRLEIRTIEHFMAAAFMSGLKDLDVYIRGVHGDHDILEMPILDGSAKNWWAILEPLRHKAQTTDQGFQRKMWRAKEKLEISDGSKRVVITPLDHSFGAQTHFVCKSAFGEHWKQELSFQVDWNNAEGAQIHFGQDIAPARTFGFKHEIDALIARGLALGGSLDNALVLDGDKVLNPEGFRVPSEIAAHKLLDAIGDFSLLELPLIAHIELVQAGHSMHLRAVEEAVRRGILVQEKL